MSQFDRMSIAAYHKLIGIKPAATPLQAYQALGRMKAGRMNKTESKYAQDLELQKHAGGLQWWVFEAIKLRLADKTWYTADFFILPNSGQLEVHEVKGVWRDDARVKIKMAAEIYPFRFRAFKYDRPSGLWEPENF